MCGLVGVAGDVSKKEIDAFNNMLVVDSIRGNHSTGVASISHTQRAVDWVKKPGNPYDLFESKFYERVVSYGKCALIGHNRYATVGKINSDNAHPFHCGDVVGAHNGTLTNLRSAGLKDVDDYGTDSEAIYQNINEFGVENVIPKLEGAWALTWYDGLDNTINFLRNDARPLYYAFAEGKKQLFWASEPAILYLCCGRNNIKLEEVKFLPSNTLMSWEIPKKWSTAFEEGTRQKLEGKPPAPVQNYGGGYSGGWKGNNNSVKSSEKKPDVKPAEGTVSDPFEDGVTGVSPSGTSSTSTTPSLTPGSQNTPTTSTTTTEKTIPPLVNTQGKPLFPTSGNPSEKPSETSSTTSPTVIGGTTTTAKTPISPKLELIQGGKADDSTFRGWKGEQLTKEQFAHLTYDGCAYCNADAEWGDEIRFFSPTEFICTECLKDPDVVNLIGHVSQ